MKRMFKPVNRQRVAEPDSAIRDDGRSQATKAADAKAQGGMLDDDTRWKAFAAAAAGARTRGFKPDLCVVAGQPFVHFSNRDDRSFLMSLGGNGKARIEGLGDRRRPW